MERTVTVILLPEHEGGYSVVCPSLPGCASQGDTLNESLANIREAAEGWLEAWQETGRPVPAETAEIVADEVRRCLRDRAEDGLPLTLETRQIRLASSALV